MTYRLRQAAGALAVLLAASLSACSAPNGEKKATNLPDDTVNVGHIHGLGIDPADGRLYVATHKGILAVSKNGDAQRVSDKADYMGFTVAGKRTFLGSGHPAPGDDAPGNRGLIKSTDAGQTWKPVSLSGKVDFHALSYAHGTVYGYDSTHGVLRVSHDGTTWDTRAELAALDITVSPEDPDVVLATTEQGVARSTDGGESFGPGTGPVLAYLSWADADALYGVDPGGTLLRSGDGGKTWKQRGHVPGGRPQALTAVDADRLLVATQNGVYASHDGGKTFDRRLAVDAGEGHH
jgi:hypothetical protein